MKGRMVLTLYKNTTFVNSQAVKTKVFSYVLMIEVKSVNHFAP